MSLTPRLDRLEKNFIINGGLDFWQRNNNFSSLSELSGYNSIDRFQVRTFNTSGTRVSAAQGGDKPNVKTPQSGLLSFTSSPTASFDLEHRIESVLADELSAAGTASFSLYVKSNEFQGVRVRINYATAVDNFTSVTGIADTTLTVTANSTWQLIKLENIAIPAGAANGLQIILSGTNVLTGSGAKEFRYAQLMLNPGIIAADFNRTGGTYARELRECQRYFETNYDTNVIPGTIANNGNMICINYATNLTTGFSFKVTKRIPPAIATYNPVTGAGPGSYGVNDGLNYAISAGLIGQNSVGSLNGGFGNQPIRFFFTADAEL